MAELRRIVWLALLAGVAAGVVVTAAQLFSTTPMILAAEVFERAGQAADHSAAGHSAAGHSAVPLRTANTLLSNVLAGAGFGLILSAILSMQPRVSVRQGVALGACAFLAVSLAPAIGLPPELPGAASGALMERQL